MAKIDSMVWRWRWLSPARQRLDLLQRDASCYPMWEKPKNKPMVGDDWEGWIIELELYSGQRCFVRPLGTTSLSDRRRGLFRVSTRPNAPTPPVHLQIV